jgi:zinc transporter ZupT
VGQALLYGVIASSALVLGALAGGRFTFPKRVLAAMLSFAAGALITAVTYEMLRTPTSKAASGERHSAWRSAHWSSPWSGAGLTDWQRVTEKMIMAARS